MISKNIPATADEIAKFCRRRHIRKLSFFGSVLRDDFDPESDADVLVEFESGHTPGLKVYDIEQELSRLCGGRRIDMVNPKYVNRWMNDVVFGTAEPVYAQGRFRLGVLHLIQTIGEAARCVSTDFQIQHPEGSLGTDHRNAKSNRSRLPERRF